MFTGVGILGKGEEVKILRILEVYGFIVSQYLYIYTSVCGVWEIFFLFSCFILTKDFCFVFNQIKKTREWRI